MKKVLALVIAAMMVISMFPVMALTTSAADVPGDWDTFRRADDYTEIDEESGEEVEKEYYAPAAGYTYTDEGFTMIGADYREITPYTTVQLKEKINVKEGFYMEFRVDDYSFGGEPAEGNYWGTADHWLSFHIVNSQGISPANLTSGQGWVSLIRFGHQGGGGPAAFENIHVESYAQSSTAFQTTWITVPKIAPEVDDEGRLILTLAASYDEEKGYSISVCGQEVGASAITTLLNELDENGEFYVGVTMMSNVKNGTAAGTILKWGTGADANAEDASVPQGSDSKDPEVNNNYIAEMTPSEEVPEGQPAMIFDATGSSWTGSKIAGMATVLTAQGDNSFKVEVENTVAYYQWSVSRDFTYEAADFPVIAFLVNDPNMVFNDGKIRYAAGDLMSADDIHIVEYELYGDDNMTFGEDEDWFLIVVDMAKAGVKTDSEGNVDDSLYKAWAGRINGLRFDSESYAYNAEATDTNYYFLHWAGVFRSVEDAQAYGTAYMSELGQEEVTASDETEAPADTDAVVDTDAADTGATADTGAADTGADSSATTDAATTESGCGSVVGFGAAAVLMAAAAAAVVLKKKD